MYLTVPPALAALAPVRVAVSWPLPPTCRLWGTACVVRVVGCGTGGATLITKPEMIRYVPPSVRVIRTQIVYEPFANPVYDLPEVDHVPIPDATGGSQGVTDGVDDGVGPKRVQTRERT
jgi:hypothetical protein